MTDRFPFHSGVLDEGRFFGRETATERLERLTRDLARGWGRSVHLWAPPGTGKTQLLTQFAHRLSREGTEVFPFYYAFPKLGWNLEDFAADFAAAFALQFLAFRKGEVAFGRRPASSAALLEGLRADDSEASAFLSERCRHFSERVTLRSPSVEASILPGVFADTFGVKILVMLDDFTHLEGYMPANLRGWSREAFRSRSTATVVTGRYPTHLVDLLGGEELAGAVENWALPPLSEEGAGRLLRSLLRVAGIEMESSLHSRVLSQAGRSPIFIEAIVKGMDGFGPVDEAAFQRAYAAATCGGEIGRYWLQLFAAVLPTFEERRTALEVLVFCLREDRRSHDVGRLAAAMMKEKKEVEGALTALQRAGLLQVDCARVRVLEDPTLRDFVLSTYRRESGGEDPALVEASLAAEKYGHAEAAGVEASRGACRTSLKRLLQGWSGQKIPKVLFSGADFARRIGHGVDEGTLEILRSEEEILHLPTVVSAASGIMGADTGMPAFEADAVAWAFYGEGAGARRQVCWVVRASGSAEVSEEEVETFDQAMDALQAAGSFAAVKVVKWLIAEGFTDEALDRAARGRILTSSFIQVRLLGAMLGEEVGSLLTVPPPHRHEVPRLEFEMTIPMVSETELVAARAVEQLAENMNFSHGEIGKIKMALVEACINAFEHSGIEEGKVRLFFTVAGGSLTIRVDNRGRRFAPSRITPLDGSPEMKKRGWGLSLIRELMDEVEFEPREEGVRLVMVKHLTGKEGIGE